MVQEQVVEALSKPEAYNEETRQIELKQTHISYVFLTREFVYKVKKAVIFGFRHSPDVAIGVDGTAIELKLIKGSQSVRDMLGQGICYRSNYRFVILVFIGRSSDEKFIEKCGDRKSREYNLLKALANDFNIFSVIGPGPDSKNIAFFK